MDKNQKSLLQMIRYGSVSAIALGADLAVLAFFIQVTHLNYLLAASFGFIIGIAINYTLSITWVFSSPKQTRRTYEFLFFCLIGIIGLGLNDAVLWVLTSGLGVYVLISKIAAAVIVWFWNFGARKKYLFS